jgi:hypothetical protein
MYQIFDEGEIIRSESLSKTKIHLLRRGSCPEETEDKN